MSDVPRSEIQHIIERLGKVERTQSRIEDRLSDLDEGLDDRVELAMRRLFEKSGKHGRDMTSWVISIIAFILMLLFALTNIAIGLWG